MFLCHLLFFFQLSLKLISQVTIIDVNKYRKIKNINDELEMILIKC